MTKLVTSGLNLTPYNPTRPGPRKIKKGMELKGYKILEIYKDQFNKIVYLVECTQCHKQYHTRFKHINKIVGCRSCTMLEGNKLHEHKIGMRIGTYTVIGFIRKTNGVPYAQVKCDCGYEGTRRNLRRIGKCQKCEANNRIGQQSGKLFFTKYLGCQKYEAICSCGKKCIAYYRSKSCGCEQKINNHRAQMTHTEVFALRELYDTGSYANKDLCDMFKIDTSHLIKIIKKKRYKF